MSFVKRMLVICSIIAIVLILFYVVMLFSTNNIYNYIQQVIKKQIIITDDKDPLIYFSNDAGPKDAAYSKFKFKRKNIWHNFSAGQMTIVFSENVFDENDNLIHQFKNIEVVIYIEKQNGEWEVSRIKRII